MCYTAVISQGGGGLSMSLLGTARVSQQSRPVTGTSESSGNIIASGAQFCTTTVTAALVSVPERPLTVSSSV